MDTGKWQRLLHCCSVVYSMSANAASEALQSSDTDLAAAAHAVEMLIEFAENMRTEEEFVRVVAAASKT